MSNKLFIIGIDKYTNHKQLKSCVRDVLDFKNILLEKYYFNEENVYELLDEKATSINIQDALNGYSKATSTEDNLVIFFSGHGGMDIKSDRGFWIPAEGSREYTSWIPNETVITLINNIKCKHIFLICDSCFSNSLLISSGTKASIDYSKHSSRWALTSAFAEAKDSDEESNTLFTETILSYLENAQSDVRVSELIEEVKRVFLSNLFQQPQGYPLLSNGHKGGEFVFETKQEIDKRTIRGYKDFNKTLQIFKRNSQFTELSLYEDKTKKIGFQIFQEVDSVVKKLTYYLYLYEGINQTQTLKYLQDNFSQIFKEKNLLVFFPKEKNLINPESRKKNIYEKFKPINLFYIDDFIREQCTPKIIQEDKSKFLSISNFILPIFSKGIEHATIDNYLIDWYEKNNEPIFVVKGTGGIGKTTFSQYIADITQKKYANTSVLFIDSVLIKDHLLKSNQNGKFKIYNFYEALCAITDSISEKLSEDIFRINIDVGNILLIIDGLDEVISKIPNFNVKEFLNSIHDSSNSIGGGKVIITCRTFFWDSIDFAEEKLRIIELEPFNLEQTRSFFEKSFDSDEGKIKKAIKLANEFKYPRAENKNIYDPYVLDIIRSLIISEKETIEVDLSSFSSKILKSNIKNDYIIYRVCDRECRRVGQVNVDDQITFFTFLAVEKRGVIYSQNLREEIRQALGKQINLTNVEALKSHPFIKDNGNSLTFRYDFLGDLFRSIYVCSYFDFSSEINIISNFFMEIISENCWFGSSLNIEIVHRLEHWSDDDILLVSDFIEQINKTNDFQLQKKRKVIANIFNLSLAINHKFYGNDIYKNTELLCKMFMKSNNFIDNLSIANIGEDQNIRFDFSGLTVSKSTIDNYGNFWNCSFDEKSTFTSCHLINLTLRKKNSDVSNAKFIDCTYDANVESSLKKVELNDVNRIEQTKIFINDFFHLFFSNGRLGRQWEDKVIKPRYYGINKFNHEYKKTIRVLKRNGLLISKEEKEGTKLFFDENYKEDIITIRKSE
ncbi:MAG: caspase family protein [bacterium]|nr:caspase family protein [bacterium]